MNMKKFLAGAFAGALALSLTAPAFATAMTNPTETLFTGAAAPNTVSVSVKKVTAPKLYVNPYGMSYSPDDSQVLAGASLATGDMVIKESSTSAGFYSDTAVIENNSTTNLGVKVTLKSESPSSGTASTAVVVAADPGSTAPTVNTLYGHFEIADATPVTGTVDSVDGVVTVTPDWATAKQVVIPACGAGSAGTATTTDTQYTLKAATVTTGMGGVTTTTPGYAAFRLTGDAYIGTTGNSWAATDLVNVTVAFTFTPAAAASNP